MKQLEFIRKRLHTALRRGHDLYRKKEREIHERIVPIQSLSVGGSKCLNCSFAAI